MANLPDREEALFEAALRHPSPSERDQFLREACQGDERLHAQVASLLRAHDRAKGFLDNPALGVLLASAATPSPAGLKPRASVPVPQEKPGDHIGHYKLLQKIGEGGCGVVYMAEQERPVRRRVALKIIKVGMDTRQVIARFEAERQALAMMEHPNIARVLDAGATETGRPFFVMDLVRGIRITDYCDQSKLSTEDRLKLFVQVCHAIQHAHQKGIIHRDIKPSNILVSLHDGVPVPVIIDFGIAKATEQRLTDKTLFTAYEQFIGTPAYMSPEQAEMSRLDLDTRSDIYSLGVLLYELLTGKTPFDPKTLFQAGLDEMRRTIREKEPPRPSTRLSTMLEADLTTVARHRRAEPLRLIHELRGDLDWIVMKCLEKDRTRRYETANGLALDVQRHLLSEPVLARPPSRLYRCQKMVRRNKAVFAAGAVVALALIVGLTVSTYLFFRQRDAYERAVLAEQTQTRLRQVAESARTRELAQHQLSEVNARQSRLNSYAADVYSAHLALQSGNLGRAVDLLEHQIPKSDGEEDLRGFEWRYLWQQARGDDLVSLPHDGLVSCAAFASAQAQQLVTASYDGVVRVWDIAARRVLRSISGFDQQFGWRYVACAPDGRWLAGIRSGKLTVWAADRENHPICFEDEVNARIVAFAPDSETLAAWGGDQLILINTSDWQRRSFPTRLSGGSFPALAFEPGGRRLALANDGRYAIEIWDRLSGSRAAFHRFEDKGGMAFVSLAWSAEGLVAAATWSGGLLLIDPNTGQELASTQAHTGTSFGLAFAPGGSSLVSAGHDQLIQFWGVPNLEPLGTLRGHRDEIWSLAISQDGRTLCTAGKDGTARLWHARPRPPPLYLPNTAGGVFSADSRAYVTVPPFTNEVTLDFWDVSQPGVRTSKTFPGSVQTRLVHVMLSSRASLAAVEHASGAIDVWSSETGKLVQSITAPGAGLKVAAFSHQGRFLALGTDSGSVEVWDLTTSKMLRLGSSSNGPLATLHFTPRDRFLRAVAREPSRNLVWNVPTGAALQIGSAERVEFSPDDRLFAATASGYRVALREVDTGRTRAMLAGHRWTINAMAFSSDGHLLATGGADAVCRLWDVRTGQERTRPLRGHLQGVTDLAFAPDGKVLATGSTDNTVKLWHVATGRELFSIAATSEPVFSPDGNTLLLNVRRGRQLFHMPPLAVIDGKQGSVATVPWNRQ